MGSFSEARSALDRATALDPGDPYNYAYRAELLRLRGQPGEAYPEARRALSLSPDDGTLLYLNALLLLDLKRDAFRFRVPAPVIT